MHMNVDDTLSARREWDVEPSSQPDKRKREHQQAPWEDRNGRVRESKGNHGVKPGVNILSSRFHNYTPLNAPVEQVFLHIKDILSIKWPEGI